MVASYTWLDETSKEILLLKIHRQWNWEDFAIMKQTADDMAMSVKHPVYYIVDHTSIPFMAIGRKSAFSTFSDAFGTAPLNVKRIYLVGFPNILSTIFMILKRITLNLLLSEIRILETVDEAISDIREEQDNSASMS